MHTPDPTTPKPQTLYFAYGSNLSLAQMKMRCPDSIFVGMGLLQDYRWIVNQRGYANIVFCGGEGEGEGAESEFGCEEGEEGSLEDGKDAENKNKNKNNPPPAFPLPPSPSPLKAAKETHSPLTPQLPIYGLLYTLSPCDETLLDTSEGVPFAYTKIHPRITLLSVSPTLSAPAVSFLLSLFPASVSTSSITGLASTSPFTYPSTSPSFSSSKPSHHSPSTTTTTTTTTATATTSQQSLPLQTRALTYIDTQRTTPSAPNPEYITRMNRGIQDALSKGFPSSYVRDVMRVYIPACEMGGGV